MNMNDIPNKEQGCMWHFAPVEGGQDQGPNEATRDLFKKSPLDNLVREALQNSLDAVDDKSRPVNVAFRWRRLSIEYYPELFALCDHISECIYFWSRTANVHRYEGMYDYIEQHKAGMPCLEISDSNTCGMRYSRDDRTSEFYAFVRSKGNSPKPAGFGGSHGFGKAAYFKMSKVQTMLVSTMAKDGSCYFEGVSTLCTHIHEKCKCSDVGFYDNNKGEPIDRSEDIPSEFRRDTVGSSMYILGVENASCGVSTAKDIIVAVLRHFWLAIMDNKLSVTIELGYDDEVVPGETQTIDAGTLDGFMQRFFNDASDRKRATSNPRPYYEAVKYAGQDRRHILFEDTLSLLGDVRLYVTRDKDAIDRVSYMRSPKMLVFNKMRPTRHGFYGVFICDDPKGNALLRLAEDGSHSEWDCRNCGKEEDIPLISDALDEIESFVSGAIQTLFSSNGADKTDITDLDEYLYIPTEIEKEKENLADETPHGEPDVDTDSKGTSVTTVPKDEKPKDGETVRPIADVMTNTKVGTVPDIGGDISVPVKPDDIIPPDPLPPSPPPQPPVPRPIPKEIHRRDEQEEPSVVSVPLTDVGCRCFTEITGGHRYYNVIIDSRKDVDDCKVSIWVGSEIIGDGKDDKDDCIGVDSKPQRIVESDDGVINGSDIIGLRLAKGKNLLRFRFQDDMRYAITLEVFEILNHENK